MVRLRNVVGLAIVGIAGIFAGESIGMTIPLEAGNTWVYEYKKSSAFSNWTRSESGFRRTGVLMMHVDSVDKRGDSTFFTISYSDSFSQVGFGDSAGVDSSSPSRISFNREYFSCSDGLYSLNANGWLKDADEFISYSIEPDFADSLYSYIHHRRTSTVSDVRANSLSCNKYVKTTHMDSSWVTMLRSTGNTLDDTITWIDRFGMYTKGESVFIQTMQMGGLSSSQGSARIYTLISFNGMPLVVGVASRPILLQSIDQRDNSSLKVPWVHIHGTSSPPYSKSPVFNLRGQPVKSNPAGQLLIRPAIRQDRH
jgi:hypothetical protein